MRNMGMERIGGVAGFGPENIGVGRVGFLMHGSMAGDLGLDCWVGCSCFLIGMGEGFGVEAAGTVMTVSGAFAIGFEVTDLTGGFGTGVAGGFGTGLEDDWTGDLVFSEAKLLTASSSDDELAVLVRLGGLAIGVVVDVSVSKVESRNGRDFGFFLGFGL